VSYVPMCFKKKRHFTKLNFEKCRLIALKMVIT
jgi:hypothetical protein